MTTTAPAPYIPGRLRRSESRLLTLAEVVEQAEQDRAPYASTLAQRTRIRDIVDGGVAGMRALLGDRVKVVEADMPAANLLVGGLERMAQKISPFPVARVDAMDDDDSKRAKTIAARQERIIATYDEIGRSELAAQTMGRWLPGYAFGVWIVREKMLADRTRYPIAQLRNPYDCFPGYWGAEQNPETLTVVRRVPGRVLRRLYPRFAPLFTDDGPGFETSWEGFSGSWTIIDHYDPTGTYVYCEDLNLMLEAVPNILGMNRFVVPHRPAFNKLIGQFDHVLGIMAIGAKLNVLAAAAMEDAVNTETNIFGVLRSNRYRKGRFATNELEVNARVEKPVNNLPYQLFEQIDRLERQLRITAGYPVTDDAESPNSFVTGKGLEELGAGASRIVREYQTILKWAWKDLDAVRLAWDETYYGNQSKSMFGEQDGVPFDETYTPSSDINGRRRTRREFGMMSGWDDSTKIIGGIQLLTNDILDDETFQENLTGLRNLPKVRNRIVRKKAMDALLAGLGERHAQQDPAASLALVNIMRKPETIEDELAKLFTPDEPQMTPEEQAMVAPPQPLDIPATPPPVLSALSRLETGGASFGGSQVVNVRRG